MSTYPTLAGQVKTSDRGFHSFALIAAKEGYEGWVKVYESSAASEPCIWVSTEEGPAVHLTLEKATLLRDQLSWLIENHYQVGAS